MYVGIEHNSQVKDATRQFQKRRSSVMTEILVLTYSHCWDKAHISHIKYWGFFLAFNYLLLILNVSKNLKIIRFIDTNSIGEI